MNFSRADLLPPGYGRLLRLRGRTVRPVSQGQAGGGGGRPNERGVVSAHPYAARKFGVHSALPLRTAYKLCRRPFFVDGHPDRYRDYSQQGPRRAAIDFAPVKMASIDEAYLDMTGTERLYGPPLRGATCCTSA